MSEEQKLKDFYKILGLSFGAADKDIKKAYFTLAKTHHPDRIADPEQKKTAQKEFIEITQAYQILSNSQQREEYDKLYHEHFSGRAPASSEDADSAETAAMGHSARRSSSPTAYSVKKRIRETPFAVGGGASDSDSTTGRERAPKHRVEVLGETREEAAIDHVPDAQKTKPSPSEGRRKKKKTSPETYLEKSKKMLAEGLYQETVDLLIDAIGKYSTSSILYRTLSIAYLRQGRMKLAQNASNHAIIHDPDNYLNYLTMGAVMERSKDLIAARKYYERSAEYMQLSNVNDPTVEKALERVNQKFRLLTHQKVSWPFIIITFLALAAFIYMMTQTMN